MGKILDTDGKAILTIFIGAIIAVTFLAPIADSIFQQRNIYTITNESVTASAVNVTLDLTGREIVTQVAINNVTGETLIDLGGIIQTGTGDDGLLSVQLLLNDTGAGWAGKTINVSYTYLPQGYLSESGARSVQGLVIIFGSLAVVVFVIIVFLKVGSMKELMKR